MPRSPAKSLTSTAASPPDTSLDPPRDAGFSLISIDPATRKGHVIVEFHGFHNEATSSHMHIEVRFLALSTAGRPGDGNGNGLLSLWRIVTCNTPLGVIRDDGFGDGPAAGELQHGGAA
jgi:hypothetical protein